MSKNLSNFRIQDAANYLGVSTKTLRRWGKSGKLVAQRSSGDHRYYSKEQLDNFLYNTRNSKIEVKTQNLNNLNGFNSNLFKLAFTAIFLSIGIVTQANSGVIYSILEKPVNNPIADIGSSNNQHPEVLAAATEGTSPSLSGFTFAINVPSQFSETATFLKDITAPNIVNSVNGSTGAVDLSLTAGTGITVDGLTVTNADTGSSQKIFKTIKLGSSSFDAGSNTDTLEFTSSGGITLTLNTTDKKLNINSAAPDYSLSGWTDAGTTVGLTTTTDSVVMDSVTFGGATITNGDSIIPDTDLGSDLGSSLKRFNNLWVANINSNSSQSFSGQTTFSYAPTDTTISQASVLINPTTAVANGQLLGLGIAGYQKALIDADGDLVLGYNSLTSAPATAYPLDIYGHSGTRVAYVDTSGNLTLGTGLGSTGALTVTPLSGSNLNVSLATTGDFAVNTNQLYVDTSAARVGIGTSSPSTALEVNSGTLLVKNNQAYGISINHYQITGGNAGVTLVLGSNQLGLDSSGNITTTGHGSSRHIFQDNQYNGSATDVAYTFKTSQDPTNWNTLVDRLSILGNGNVGIGTTTPTSKLHVSGAVTGKALAIFDETGDQALFTASASGVSKVIIDHNGRVGIGTIAPGYSLTVNTSTANDQGVRSINTATTGSNYGGVFTAQGSGATLNVGLYTNAASGTTNYGLWVDAISAAANNYAIYSGSAAQSYFQGNVGVGTTAPTTKFHVSGATVGKALSIFNETGDQALLTASASGVTKFIIDHSGNVGIGTTNPTKLLHVQVASGDGIAISHNSSYQANATRGIYFYGNNTQSKSDGAILSKTITGNGGELEFFTSSNGDALSQAMVIDKSGNVGIGTTAPTTKFHVSGATVGKALSIFNETGDQAVFTASVSGVSKVTINNSGYLGIGTVSPTNALEVVGAMRVGGNSTVNRYVTVGTTGTLTSRIDNNGLNNVLVLENRDVNGDEGAGILFNLAQSGSNNAVNAGKIYVIKEQAWTSTASTRDSAIVFNTSKDGTQTETLRLSSSGLLNGTVGGLASYVKAGTISDTDFTDTPVDGLFGFDTTNHRLYFREGAAWSYIAKTGGFQIPDFEAEGLSTGDFLVPYVESTMSDGAVHGLYAKWSDVKASLLSDVWNKINDIENKLIALKDEVFTKKSHQEELCIGTSGSETCINKEQLDKIVNLLPSSTPSASPNVISTETPSPTLEPTPSTTPEASPSATPI